MPADALSLTFAALADPTRRAILARLASGACSVTDLAAPFEMSMPAVSKHLRVLERAGLVARGREAQWRPCRIEAAPLKAVADWAERYRAIWEGRLDRLDGYLRDLQAGVPRRGAPGAATPEPHVTRPAADRAAGPGRRSTAATPTTKPKEKPHARKPRRH
jgi:DNA-binding transcriptional ArsR family regulator